MERALSTEEIDGLSRKALQALSKQHKIPANLSNVELRNQLTQHFQSQATLTQNGQHPGELVQLIDSAVPAAEASNPYPEIPPGTTRTARLRDASIGSVVSTLTTTSTEITVSSLKNFIFGEDNSNTSFNYTSGQAVDKILNAEMQEMDCSDTRNELEGETVMEELDRRMREGKKMSRSWSSRLGLSRDSNLESAAGTASGLTRSLSKKELFDSCHEKEFASMRSIIAPPAPSFMKRSVSKLKLFSSSSKGSSEADSIDTRPTKKARPSSTIAPTKPVEITSPRKRIARLIQARKAPGGSARKPTIKRPILATQSVPPLRLAPKPVILDPAQFKSTVSFDWTKPPKSTSNFGQSSTFRSTSTLANPPPKKAVYDPKASLAQKQVHSYKPKTGPLPPTFEPSSSSTLHSTLHSTAPPPATAPRPNLLRPNVLKKRVPSNRVVNDSLLVAVKPGGSGSQRIPLEVRNRVDPSMLKREAMGEVKLSDRTKDKVIVGRKQWSG